MRTQNSNLPILTAAVMLWFVIAAAAPVICRAWLTAGWLSGLIILETGLSIALVAARLRVQKAHDYRRQLLARLSAIERGIL